MVDDACGKRLEVEFVEHGAHCLEVGWPALQLLFIEVHGHISLDGGEELGEPDLVGIVLDLVLEAAFEFAC